MDTALKDEYWQEYWIRVKENISNNNPILTSVDPFRISSFRKVLDVPDLLFDIMPPSGHGIVLVGYNESNETVCYNDPAAALFGHPEYGTYAWMNLTDFNEAIIRTLGSKYVILTYNKVSDPLSKEEAFNRSHSRNIEKLRGNLSVYSEYFLNMSKGAGVGINGSKMLKNDFEKGIKNRFTTILTYKLKGKLGLSYRLLKIFGPILIKLLGLPAGSAEKLTIDEFRRIAIEKTWMANFLNENSELSSICEYEAKLFENEAKYWNKLSSLYSVFKKRGITLSFPRSIFVINRMSKTMDEIIQIEEVIVNSAVCEGGV